MRRFLALLVVALGLTGCGGSPPPGPTAGPTVTIDPTPSARDRLAAVAAAAKDRRYVATYLLQGGNRDRTVTVALGSDGTWVVAVPGGALGGLADIAIYRSSAGLHQCLLGPASGTVGSRPDLGPLVPFCTVVPSLGAREDPRVQHVFTDWIDRLIDRASALSVTSVTLPAVQGTCFSVESTAAALAPPVDPGVYCYADDGILTYARAGFGTLLLAGAVEPAPPSVALPAPVTDREPLPTAAPTTTAP